MLLYLVCAVATLVSFIYLYFLYSYSYWQRKGIPYLQPKIPLGNNDCWGTEQLAFGLEAATWHNEFKSRGLKFGGVWNWCHPVLVLTDPELIKDVLQKDFKNFTERDFFHDPKHYPKQESLFVVSGDSWKTLRQKMTPIFTSAKIKMMFDLVKLCSEPMIEHLEVLSKTGEDINIKDVAQSFTMDVIGTIGFGLNCGSFSREGGVFRQVFSLFFIPDFSRKIRNVLTRAFPEICKMLRISNMEEKIFDFFTDVINKSVEHRDANNIRKPDYLQLVKDLYENTKNDPKPFTYEELIGNVILFFGAGFETSANTINFALYELARNPDVQDQARREIEDVLSRHKGELTYEALQEMTYLRQVVDETLRLYPPVSTLTRISEAPYTIRGTNYTIDKRTPVVISAAALGRDPDYFPDPEKFDPERFSPTNKDNINQYAYLPFGEGPRICIGKRFGMVQSSIGIIQVLRNYKVSISSSTKMPLTLKRGLFLISSNETLYLKAEKL